MVNMVEAQSKIEIFEKTELNSVFTDLFDESIRQVKDKFFDDPFVKFNFYKSTDEWLCLIQDLPHLYKIEVLLDSIYDYIVEAMRSSYEAFKIYANEEDYCCVLKNISKFFVLTKNKILISMNTLKAKCVENFHSIPRDFDSIDYQDMETYHSGLLVKFEEKYQNISEKINDLIASTESELGLFQLESISKESIVKELEGYLKRDKKNKKTFWNQEPFTSADGSIKIEFDEIRGVAKDILESGLVKEGIAKYNFGKVLTGEITYEQFKELPQESSGMYQHYEFYAEKILEFYLNKKNQLIF